MNDERPNISVALIWAMDQTRLIGAKNELPWSFSEDLRFFRKTTSGHAICMGRKTFESIGRSLPKRYNLVITRSPAKFRQKRHSSLDFVSSFEEAQTTAQTAGHRTLFVIGGAEIYRQTLDIADELYITKIEASFQGDTYFPEFDENDFEQVDEKVVPNAGPNKDTTLRFLKLIRRQK